MNAQPAIPPFLDRRPIVGSFTMLNTFKNCEHQAYRRYVKRDQPYVETPEMKWGTDVHSAFENRLGGKHPLPANMQQWEPFAQPYDRYAVHVEQKLGMTVEGKSTGFFDKNVWFRGKADAVVLDTEKALITDWKTGNGKYEDPFELETNALLLKAKHPSLKKVVGRYIWLKESRAGQMYDLSDFGKTWTEVKRLMDLIFEKRKTEVWEKWKSGLCGWCSVADCENWRERK